MGGLAAGLGHVSQSKATCTLLSVRTSAHVCAPHVGDIWATRYCPRCVPSTRVTVPFFAPFPALLAFGVAVL